MTSRSAFLLLIAITLGSPAAAADLPAPPPPAEYDVQIRYQIDAFRNERLLQYFPMLRYFESLGFERKGEPDEGEPENPNHTLIVGTIPAKNARKLLAERHVRSVLLLPKGTVLGADAAAEPVRVHLELAGGLTPERQWQLAEQVRVVLADLGFHEGIGYDDREHTRLVGSIPPAKVKDLLTDLRRQPAGRDLPGPFRTGWPLRLTEVLPGFPLPKERPAPPLPPKGQEKIAPELRQLLAADPDGAKPARMEVILVVAPGDDNRTWPRDLLDVAPDWQIEGRLGPLVTVFGPIARAKDMADLPLVSTVRLARSGQPRPQEIAASKGDAREAVKASGVGRMHLLGRRGKWQRVVIIDGDFRGWRDLVGKDLPKGTTLIDLTAERNRRVLPDDYAGDAKEIGHGTRIAQAAALAAPEAEFTLVRIDPEAPHMLQEVARAINGEEVRTFSLDQRYQDLEAERGDLQRRMGVLAPERRYLLERVGLDPELAKRPDRFGLDPVRDKALIDRQAAYVKAQAKYDEDEREYRRTWDRWLQLRNDLKGLKGTTVVASSLVWNEGHPVDGSSALSRYFDDRPFRAAVWFQAAGNTRGQAWSGPFRDADNDGVMEFAPPGTVQKPGRWTTELNFLAWEPAGKPQTVELPAGARLRLAVQWREAHDPEFLRNGEDPYRESLANLQLVVLRQLDPSGQKQPADDMEVVAQSVSLPQRIDNQPAWGTYEQTVEFTVKEAGRYAVRVEGRLPKGTRPPDSPALDRVQRTGELKPRVFVATTAGEGRAVFLDFAPAVGMLGMPGDAHRVVTVGAVSLADQRQPYSAGGPPLGLELLPKPDVLAYDELGLEGEAKGTSLATGFAAGLGAIALGSGAPVGKFVQALQPQPAAVFRIPKKWQ
jgi:hypothetical protein